MKCFLVRQAPEYSSRVSMARNLRSKLRREGEYSPNEDKFVRTENACTISFSNESQFLLLSEASVDSVRQKVPNLDIPIVPINFRPNFVVSGGYPYQEDSWKHISIGNEKFEVNLFLLYHFNDTFAISKEFSAGYGVL